MTLKQLTETIYPAMKNVGASKTACEDLARSVGAEIVDLLDFDSLPANRKPRPACADTPIHYSSQLRMEHRNALREYATFWVPQRMLVPNLTSSAYLTLIKFCESKCA